MVLSNILNLNKKAIGGLLGGGVIFVASLGGIKLKDRLDWDAKINYYGKLSNYFAGHAPEHIRRDFYMPKWEDDEKWQKIHKRTGKINGKGTFATYQAMRDACYELVKNDKDFHSCTSSADTWCTDCTRGKSWDNIT